MKKNQIYILLIVVGILLLICPLFVGQYIVHIIIITSIWVLLIGGLNLICTAGYNSICQAAFFGVGAYVAALLALRVGTPFWFNLIAAMFISGVIGYLFGFPAFRVRGHYFSIISLAFGLIANLVYFNFNTVTGGDRGLVGIFPPPCFFGVNYYYLVLGLTFVVMFISYRLLNSKFGRQLVAIREDEDLSQQIGINVQRCKLIAFSLAASFAGLAGGLMVNYVNFVHPEFFSFSYSFTMLVAVLIGGRGTTLGVVLGAVIAIIFPEIFRFAGQMRYIFLGIVMIIVVYFLPDGLGGTILHILRPKKRNTKENRGGQQL